MYTKPLQLENKNIICTVIFSLNVGSYDEPVSYEW